MSHPAPTTGAESHESLNAVIHAEGQEHGGGHAAGPELLGMGPVFWVALAMTVFIGILLWKRVPAAIGRALDGKIAAIRQQLDEAARLRADAEALKAEYEAKSAAAGQEAETIVERARHEAEAILAQAQTDAAALVERRTRMAEDKIAAAERAAVDEVRAKAARAAAAAAEGLIRQNLDAAADKPMVDATIAGLSLR